MGRGRGIEEGKYGKEGIEEDREERQRKDSPTSSEFQNAMKSVTQ